MGDGIALSFKKFINSFGLDPVEVAIYVANYLNDNNIKANGSNHITSSIPLFDNEEEEK